VFSLQFNHKIECHEQFFQPDNGTELYLSQPFLSHEMIEPPLLSKATPTPTGVTAVATGATVDVVEQVEMGRKRPRASTGGGSFQMLTNGSIPQPIIQMILTNLHASDLLLHVSSSCRSLYYLLFGRQPIISKANGSLGSTSASTTAIAGSALQYWRQMLMIQLPQIAILWPVTRINAIQRWLTFGVLNVSFTPSVDCILTKIIMMVTDLHCVVATGKYCAHKKCSMASTN
jgi:hypothetical protein